MSSARAKNQTVAGILRKGVTMIGRNHPRGGIDAVKRRCFEDCITLLPIRLATDTGSITVPEATPSGTFSEKA